MAAQLDDTYGSLILSHQPVGYWRHREAGLYGQSTIDGEQVVDGSGYGMHGIYRSLPADHVVSGIFHGDSLAFVAGNPMGNFPGGAAENFGYFSDGPDEVVIDSGGARIEIPHDSSLTILEDFSFEIWLRPRPESDWRYNLVAMNSEHQYNRFGNNDFGYFLLDYWQYPRGDLPSYVSKADFTWAVASYHWSGWSATRVYEYEFKEPSLDPEAGAETHLVGVHESDVISLYINGRLAASRGISGDSGLTGSDGQTTTGSGFRQDLTDIFNPPDPAKPLMIGGARDIESGAHFLGFSGSLGESAFYRRALSADEVLEHYEAGLAPDPAEPVLKCTGATRGELVECTVSVESATAVLLVTGWRFDAGGFLIEETSTSTTWGGDGVVSGTVTANILLNGVPDSVSAPLDIAPRSWQWSSGDGIFYDSGGLEYALPWAELRVGILCHPSQGCPEADSVPKHQLYVQPQDPQHANGYNHKEVTAGPNEGIWYVESVGVDVQMASTLNPEYLPVVSSVLRGVAESTA